MKPLSNRKLKVTMYWLSNKLFRKRYVGYTYEELANMFQVPEREVRSLIAEFDREMRKQYTKK